VDSDDGDDRDGDGDDDDDALSSVGRKPLLAAISLSWGNGIDLSVPALADLLPDKPKYNIFEHLGSDNCPSSLPADRVGDKTTRKFDLSEPLEF